MVWSHTNMDNFLQDTCNGYPGTPACKIWVAFSFYLNSLAPGRSECDSKNVIFNLVLLIGIFRSSHDDTLQWTPLDLTDDKSTLVQVMAWCRQVTSLYLSQCWPRSVLPYGIIRPQLVNLCAAISGLILGLGPANERQCYFVTMSLIGWAQA